jgi:hypothetical protein
MSYQIINDLPFGFYFSGQSKDQLKQYKNWFLSKKDERLKYLEDAVKSSLGFENWKDDFTPESLKDLGRWLMNNIKTETLSPEAYKIKRQKVPEYIEINDWDLTNETYSKLIDTGIYFGEVYLHNYSHLKWEQFLTSRKNHSSLGHMVLKGFGKLELNPLRVVYITGSSMVDKKADENSLYELYLNWASYLP